MYCDEGGDEFWKVKRGNPSGIGTRLAEILNPNSPLKVGVLRGGRCSGDSSRWSWRRWDSRRRVSVHNLRVAEVRALNRACSKAGVRFKTSDASYAQGPYDHIWMVSVANDPERLPELSALSYGRAEPSIFNPAQFARQRRTVRTLVKHCLAKLRQPGWATTTTKRYSGSPNGATCATSRIESRNRSTQDSTVGDPVCMVRLE